MRHNVGICYNYRGYAPVAQRIRVLGFEPSGRRFESCRVYHKELYDAEVRHYQQRD